MITDEMLQGSAFLADCAILDSLSKETIEPHTFSPAFERRIKRLDRRASHPYLHAALSRAASIALVILITGSVWLSVDIEARAAFIQWAREMYEESILYRYFNAPQDGTLPTYEITALPDGYTLTDSIVDETSCVQLFENEEKCVIFAYYFTSSDTQNELIFFDGYTYEPVTIKNISADYYAAANTDETNELLWVDDQQSIAFQLSAFLAKEEMLEIADSVARIK